MFIFNNNDNHVLLDYKFILFFPKNIVSTISLMLHVEQTLLC